VQVRCWCESPDLTLHIALSDELPTVRCASSVRFPGSYGLLKSQHWAYPVKRGSFPVCPPRTSGGANFMKNDQGSSVLSMTWERFSTKPTFRES
jgi:hypothetical protein